LLVIQPLQFYYLQNGKKRALAGAVSQLAVLLLHLSKLARWL
jgi:hypothetical protein